MSGVTSPSDGNCVVFLLVPYCAQQEIFVLSKCFVLNGFMKLNTNNISSIISHQ